MEIIARDCFAIPNLTTGKANQIWYYSPEDEWVYRDYGDGKVVKEMPYIGLKAMADTVNDISRLKMKCMRELVQFVRNKEAI